MVLKILIASDGSPLSARAASAASAAMNVIPVVVYR